MENYKDKIITEYTNGKSTNKIADELKCNSGTVYYYLKKWGVTIQKTYDNYGKLKEHIQEIKDLHSKGFSAYKIGKTLGFSKTTILRELQKLGLSTSDKYKLKNPVRLKDCQEQIVSMNKAGLTTQEISRQTGYGQSKIWEMLNKLGLDTSHKYYDVNLNFFDIIDTEEKAYYLGMWYADGNVRPDQIRLQVADEEIVLGAKKALNYHGPIKTIIPKVEGRKVQYNLGIARQELVNAITNKGCPPNKSLILTFPGIGIVPTNLIHHFIRGWFDGDGNIYNHKGQDRWRIQLVGTREFLYVLSKNIGVTGYWSQRFPERNNNNWCFSIGKIDQVIKFLEFIYKGATVSLNRKKLQADKCLADLRSRMEIK